MLDPHLRGSRWTSGFASLCARRWCRLWAACLVLPLAYACCGCSEQKTVIPSGELTEAQKQAIKAEDAKVAEEEGHGRAR